MVVDGIRWVVDVKLCRGRVKGIDESEQEAVWRAREFATFETTAPADVCVASEHTTTGCLDKPYTHIIHRYN